MGELVGVETVMIAAGALLGVPAVFALVVPALRVLPAPANTELLAEDGRAAPAD